MYNISYYAAVYGQAHVFAGGHWNPRIKIASKWMGSTNNDELSEWSCVSIISMALPAKTTLFER